MENCYKILGVSSSATAAEIKRAYRQKVKELHPDTSKSPDDVEEFRRVVKAYEILSDVQRRAMFDVSYGAMGRRYAKEERNDSFDYRSWLLARADNESRAKLIFFDLLHGREDLSVEEFVRMTSEHADFSLADWFTREDFMDVGFILCEELVLRAHYYDAALLLTRIAQMEQSYQYFKHFYPEVLSLLKEVLFKRLEGYVSDELALDAWERVLELNLLPAEEAELLVKMAMAYNRIGDEFAAESCFAEAVRIDKKIKIPTKRGSL